MSFSTFDDFDKAPKDIFKKDFDVDTCALKIKTAGPQGLDISSTLDFYTPKTVSSKISFSKKFAQFSLDKLELKSGTAVIETSLVDVLPGLKLEFKGDDKVKGDFSALYKIPQATFTGEFDIVNFSSAKASVSTGYSAITAGGNGHLEVKDGKPTLKDFSFGVGYTVPKSLFVGVRANKKVTDFGANFLYNVNKDVTVAGAVTYPKASLAFGATYKCNPNTALKFKLATDGKLGASANQKIDATTSVCAAAAIDVNNIGAYQFGVIASLG